MHVQLFMPAPCLVNGLENHILSCIGGVDSGSEFTFQATHWSKADLPSGNNTQKGPGTMRTGLHLTARMVPKLSA